ncbi:MAG: DegQ family serine endoprotease [Gammaproteobacteria bacterium]|nr:DegQ family serine endoprotease [Gammaproteobacteria bacterium]
MVNVLKASALLVGLLLVLPVQSAQLLGLPDFTEIVEQTNSAVVNISTTTKTNSAALADKFLIPNLPPGSPFEDLFRRFLDRDGRGRMMPEQNTRSLGSGFVISKDGYIMTNSHVVAGADEVIVRLNDKREFVAEIIGVDKRSDVALIKVDAKNLPVVKMGSSEKLKVGEWVLAIGSPFGFDYSVTSGIVSAKGRNLPNDNYVPFIQTDVAINPGNSGGPLFNLDGEVVGINSQIYSRTGGFMGLSFAIPIEVATDVVAQLKDKGHVSRGWLGVLIQEVTRDLADSFGMKKPVGALVARVMPNSPAEDAGLKVGDVIVKFNSKTVDKSTALPSMVGRTKINSSARVKVIRNGSARFITVKIGLLPEQVGNAMPVNKEKAKLEDTRLGLIVDDLDDAVKQKLTLKRGVVVSKIKPGVAASAGVRRGDVIVRINNKAIKNKKDFQKTMQDLGAGSSVALLIQRRAGPIFLAMRLPK